MKIPDVLEGALTVGAVVGAINGLMIEGQPTIYNCAGACELRRHPALKGHPDLDLHYTAAHLSIKRRSAPTQYWRKDKNAKLIDRTYDETFSDVLTKFGHPRNWFTRRSEIEGFVLDRMMHLIGLPFVLTKLYPKNKGGHSRDPKTGKVTGGRQIGIQCHVTRTARIAQMVGQCEAQ